MTEKELKRLGKAELCELVAAQGKKIERLEEDVSDAKQMLDVR